MSKELWVRADGTDSWEERKELVKTALESGAQTVVVNAGEEKLVRELGKIKVVSTGEDSDILLTDDIKKIKKSTAFYCEIKSKEDERLIAEAGKTADYVIINAKDWKVIPLENLIAELKGKCKILAEAGSESEARLAMETLEIGTDGVLASADFQEVKKIKKLIDSLSAEKLQLRTVKVTAASPGEGDAMAIDTCSILNLGEGLLADNFLVHSDTEKTPWMEPAPFRINIGTNSKIKTPDGIKKVKELKPGDEILSANFEGRTRRLIVNEITTSKKKMLKVSADNSELVIPDDSALVGRKGKKIPAGKLKPGDEISISQ